MVIAVKCTNCHWQGNAEVSKRHGGKPLSEYQCPWCQREIKRRSGTYKIGDKFADDKKPYNREL